MKKEKGNLEKVADKTKSVARIVMWSIMILSFIVIIPMVWMSAQMVSSFNSFLQDVKTDKSINFIGTLMSEEAADSFANALAGRLIDEGCDSKDISLITSYDMDSDDYEKEIMNEDKHINTKKRPLNNYSLIDDSEILESIDSARDYLRDNNNTISFKMDFKYNAKGCYRKVSLKNETI